MLAVRTLAAVGISEDHPYYKKKFGLYTAANYTQAMKRPVVGPADRALYTPELDVIFNELDAIIEARIMRRAGKNAGPDDLKRKPEHAALRDRATEYATMLRAGSVARFRWQSDFYYRLGSSPWVRTVCEVRRSAKMQTRAKCPLRGTLLLSRCFLGWQVGFNAGHSTALWLHSNPLVHVYSFDIAHKADLLRYFDKTFPGRLHAYTGDSSRVIRPTRLPSPCDIVHIDGRHDFAHSAPPTPIRQARPACNRRCKRTSRICGGSRLRLSGAAPEGVATCAVRFRRPV